MLLIVTPSRGWAGLGWAGRCVVGFATDHFGGGSWCVVGGSVGESASWTEDASRALGQSKQEAVGLGFVKGKMKMLKKEE